MLAHEMSHVRNYDVRLMTWAAVLAGSIALLAQIFLRGMWFGGGDRDRRANPIVLVAVIAALVLAPIAAVLIQFAISRRREYVADASAAELTPLSPGPGVGAAGHLGRHQALGAARQPRDRAHDDRRAAGRQGPELQAFLDAPARRGAHRGAGEAGGRSPAPSRDTHRGPRAAARRSEPRGLRFSLRAPPRRAIRPPPLGRPGTRPARRRRAARSVCESRASCSIRSATSAAAQPTQDRNAESSPSRPSMPRSVRASVIPSV